MEASRRKASSNSLLPPTPWERWGVDDAAANQKSLAGGGASIPAKWWQSWFVAVAVTTQVGLACYPLLAVQSNRCSLLLPLVGVFASDLYTGTVHYTFDHFTPEMWIFGGLVSTFHQHHADPTFIFRAAFVAQACKVLLTMLVPLALLSLLCVSMPTCWLCAKSNRLSAVYGALAWKTLGMVYCEFSHRMAHMYVNWFAAVSTRCAAYVRIQRLLEVAAADVS
jgi:hypothetical protein